jgi:ABC-type multidrug transport system ATPase subunit
VGGTKINPVQFRTQIAYVMQDDALMATTTPREALRFSANLRMVGVSAEEIEEAVDHTLKALGIEECADTFIGSPLIKGISGGQRKRTSVGVELITQPSLLFLDEPTSGLDSHTAYTLVKLLKQIASSNASILCTIHQPSSEVFFLFDSCIFLKKGQVLFQGPVSKLTAFFSSMGYECPQNYNPADFVMFLSQTESKENLEQRGIFAHAATNSSKQLSIEDSASSSAAAAGGADETFHVQIKSSFYTQLVWLFKREFTNTYRNKPALAGRFGVTIVLSIIFGLIFGGAGDSNNADQDEISGHFGSMTMVMISAMFGSGQPTLLEFPSERPMFMREYSTGTYSVITYSIAKLTMEIPILFLQCIVQFALVYNMIEFQGDFIILVLGAFGTGAASSSLAVLLGCIVDDVKQATEMAPLLFVPQILFAGFFIRTSLIPVYLRWAQYLCSLKYGLNIVLMNEFSPSQDSCQVNAEAAMNCAKILEDNGIERDDWWIYVCVLAALFVGIRAIAMFVLAKKAVKFY